MGSYSRDELLMKTGASRQHGTSGRGVMHVADRTSGPAITAAWALPPPTCFCQCFGVLP